MKPSRVPIILNALSALAFTAASVLAFLAGESLRGWMYVACVLMMSAATAFSVATYRNLRRTGPVYSRRVWRRS